ncbi:hypothetical protein JZU56_04930, partial [bacterium]|nr:hypothetical protein [bacterium]
MIWLMILLVFSLGATSTFAVWTTQTCPDGRVVAIAPEGTGYCGRDGRTVSVPKDWGKDAGSDQRLVAIPPQGRAKRGSDGR